MGLVYRAEDTKLKRQVALKFLPHYSLTDKSALERFEREAQAASALQHLSTGTIQDIAQGPGAAGHQLKNFTADEISWFQYSPDGKTYRPPPRYRLRLAIKQESSRPFRLKMSDTRPVAILLPLPLASVGEREKRLRRKI
jgi:hypothetical protein